MNSRPEAPSPDATSVGPGTLLDVSAWRAAGPESVRSQPSRVPGDRTAGRRGKARTARLRSAAGMFLGRGEKVKKLVREYAAHGAAEQNIAPRPIRQTHLGFDRAPDVVAGKFAKRQELPVHGMGPSQRARVAAGG